jgi:hypothetical protein
MQAEHALPLPGERNRASDVSAKPMNGKDFQRSIPGMKGL